MRFFCSNNGKTKRGRGCFAALPKLLDEVFPFFLVVGVARHASVDRVLGFLGFGADGVFGFPERVLKRTVDLALVLLVVGIPRQGGDD